jgi:hypothetical protein
LKNIQNVDPFADLFTFHRLKVANYFLMGSTLVASMLLIGGTGKMLLHKSEPKDELKIEF